MEEGQHISQGVEVQDASCQHTCPSMIRPTSFSLRSSSPNSVMWRFRVSRVAWWQHKTYLTVISTYLHWSLPF